MVTSGIRIGTPAVTTRGMSDAEMQQIGGLICDVLGQIENPEIQAQVKAKVEELCRRFPLYASRLN
jgi:glycine hydroxymethyltransferase